MKLLVQVIVKKLFPHSNSILNRKSNFSSHITSRTSGEIAVTEDGGSL